MIKLADALAGVTNLGFDTAPVIYFVEAHPKYDALVTPIFEYLEQGTLTGWSSVVTLSEVLVQPILKADTKLQQQYRDLLLSSANFYLLAITADIAERTAELRAALQRGESGVPSSLIRGFRLYIRQCLSTLLLIY